MLLFLPPLHPARRLRRLLRGLARSVEARALLRLVPAPRSPCGRAGFFGGDLHPWTERQPPTPPRAPTATDLWRRQASAPASSTYIQYASGAGASPSWP